MTTTIDLPRKPSELIRLAVRDARALYETQREDYLPSYDEWHAGRNGNTPCRICDSGAVIARTLGADPDETCYPENFPDENEDQIQALDDLQRGYHADALRYLGYPENEAVRHATETAPDPANQDYYGWDDFLLHLGSLERVAAHYAAHGM